RQYALSADGLLTGSDSASQQTLARSLCVIRALSANRHIAAVTNPAIGLNFNQPANVHLNLLAEIALNAAFLLDGLADMVDFIFRQVANLLRVIHAGLRDKPACARLPDAIDRGQPDPKALLRRKIYTCYACHDFSKF